MSPRRCSRSGFRLRHARVMRGTPSGDLGLRFAAHCTRCHEPLDRPWATRPVGAGNAFGCAMSASRSSLAGRVVGERARRSWRVRGWVGRCRGGSGCLAVLVDESVAGGVSSDRLAGPIRDDVRDRRVRVGRATGGAGACCSARRSRVGAVRVGGGSRRGCGRGVRGARCRPSVPRRRSRPGAYGGVRMMVVPSLRKTSSNAAMNWPAPSRIRNRIVRS